MRSRKKSRQTAETTANVGAQGEDAAEAPAQSDVFTAEQTSHKNELSTSAAVRVEPAEAAETFDKSVDGPDAQVAAEPDASLSMDPKELLTHLRQRVLDNPNDVQSRVRLGQLHDKRSEPLLALEQYQAAVTAEPDNPLVVLQFAQALTNLNRFAEAERELRRVLKLEPDHGMLHLQLGTISFRRGLYSQAEIELKRAIELLPDAAYAYFHRGESLNQLSRIDEALDMLERGVALDPTYSRAYYIMGILYDRKSRPQEAGAMYKRAREVAGT